MVFKRFISIIAILILLAVSLVTDSLGERAYAKHISPPVPAEPANPLFTGDGNPVLLIITPAEFTDTLDALVQHKNRIGMLTAVETLEDIYLNYDGADEPEEVKLAIADYVETYGTDYVMLVGDCNWFPVRWQTGHLVDGLMDDADNTNDDIVYVAADYYYADLYDDTGAFNDWDADGDGYYGEIYINDINPDGIDPHPDVAVGRVPAANEGQLLTYVNKVITYESAAYDSEWFKNLLLIQVEWSESVFAKENIADCLEPLGFETTRMYASIDPADYSGPIDYVPDSVNIADAFNRGYGFVSELYHGSNTSWDYLFNTANVSGLTNSPMFPVIYSGGCTTASFYGHTIPYRSYTGVDGLLHGPYAIGAVGDTRVTQPAPIQPTGDVYGIGEAFLLDPNGAIAYYGSTETGETKFHRTLDESFFQAYSLGHTNLGDMWTYAVETFAAEYHLDTLVSDGTWNAICKMHTPSRFVLLGDPSLHVGGVSPVYSPPGTEWSRLSSLYSAGRDIIRIDNDDDDDYYVVGGYGWDSEEYSVDRWGLLAKYDLDGNDLGSASILQGEQTRVYSLLYDPARDRFVVTGTKYDEYNDGPQEWAHDMVWLATIDAGTLEFRADETYPNAFENRGNSIILDGGDYIIGGWDSISVALHQGNGWLGKASSETGDLAWELGENADGDSLWLGTAEIYSVVKTFDEEYLLLGTEDGIVKLYLADLPAPTSLVWQSAQGAKYHSVTWTGDGGCIGVGEVTVHPGEDDSHTDIILTKIDADGNVDWSTTYGRSSPVIFATGMDDVGYDVIRKGDGYMVTGYTESYGWHGGKDLVIIEFDLDGNMVWDQVLGGEGNDEGRSIVTAPYGGYVVTGTAEVDGIQRLWTLKTLGGFRKPEAHMTYTPDSPLFIEDPVHFSGTGSLDYDGWLIHHFWDYGDGTTGTGPITDHRYHAPGTYTATLYVVDNDGLMAESSQTVITKQMEMQWQEFYGNGNDWGQALALAPDGGFVVAGVNVAGAAYGNVWAFKTDNCGNPVWERVFADTHGYIDGGRTVIAAHDGGYIVGAFRETAGSPVRNRDIWLLKLDETDGHKIWEKFYDYGTGIDEVYDIQYDGDGYILTGCATATDAARFRDILLLKIDAEGNEVWHELYPDTVTNKQTCGYSVALTSDGGYIITGGYAQNKNTTGPCLTIKIAADRSEEWRTNTAGATTKSSGYYIEQADDGGYVAAGTLGGDYALLGYSASGHLDWQQTWDMGYNADYGLAAASFTDGGYIIVGNIMQLIDSQMCDDMYIVRTDAVGNLYWDWCTDTVTPTEGANDVIAFANGSYVVLGTRYLTAGSAGGTWLYRIGPNSVPAAAFTYTPATPGVGAPVHFDASTSSDDEGSIAEYLWDFGDGDTGSGVTIDHAYAAVGTYEVTLSIVDADGGVDNITHSVTVVAGMVIDFSADQRSGPVPLPVAFESSIIGGTPPFTYAWDFDNDGEIDAATANAAWTYNSPGVYSVSLAVTDDTGLVDSLLKLNYIVATGVIASDPDVTITTSDFTDDPSSDPDTYDPTGAPADIEWATARGFDLAAGGPDGTYDFYITFASPLDPGFILYKLPGWTEIPYVVIDDYTIRISLEITGGVLDPPFILAGIAGQTWKLDSDIPLVGLYQMEKSGSPGDDGQTGSVEVAAGPGVIWLSDQTALSPVVFPAGDWRIRIKTLDWEGVCSAQVGEYDGSLFNAFNTTPVDGTPAGDLITFTIPNTGGTIPADHYLALRLFTDDGGYIITDGNSYLSSPTSDPGFPLFELTAGLLLLLGLAGLSGFIFFRKTKTA